MHKVHVSSDDDDDDENHLPFFLYSFLMILTQLSHLVSLAHIFMIQSDKSREKKYHITSYSPIFYTPHSTPTRGKKLLFEWQHQQQQSSKGDPGHGFIMNLDW